RGAVATDGVVFVDVVELKRPDRNVLVHVDGDRAGAVGLEEVRARADRVGCPAGPRASGPASISGIRPDAAGVAASADEDDVGAAGGVTLNVCDVVKGTIPGRDARVGNVPEVSSSAEARADDEAVGGRVIHPAIDAVIARAAIEISPCPAGLIEDGI